MKHLTIILLVGEHFKRFSKIFSRNFILIKKKTTKNVIGVNNCVNFSPKNQCT